MILTTFIDYGCQGLFQNYIANHPDGRDGPKGLGLGHAGATGLNVFFQFFCYVTPILGAIIADQYLGKYNTILVFAVIYWVGVSKMLRVEIIDVRSHILTLLAACDPLDYFASRRY